MRVVRRHCLRLLCLNLYYPCACHPDEHREAEYWCAEEKNHKGSHVWILR